MDEQEKHVLILCVVVFTLLASVLTVLITIIYKQTMQLIRVGGVDEKLKNEYAKSKKKKGDKVWNIINIALQVLLWLAVLGALIFTIYMSTVKDNVVGDTPQLKTVNSSSMSEKLPENKYLFDNNINNQIKMNDIVLIKKIPKIEDIKLYDVILYESDYDGTLVLHRVIAIYEPGTFANKDRAFLLQGDAVTNYDSELVEYSQMKGIYANKRIGGLGEFVRFMNSPAGYTCIIFAFALLISMPIFEAHYEKAKIKRLKEIGYIE